MKLYDVPNKSYVRPLINQSEETLIRPQEAGKQSEVKVPIGVSSVDTGQLIYFRHIDGMYSLCHEVNEDTLEHGEVTHIAAWTEVEVVDLKSLFTFDQLREKVGRSGYGKDGRGTGNVAGRPRRRRGGRGGRPTTRGRRRSRLVREGTARAPRGDGDVIPSLGAARADRGAARRDRGELA